ncbi:MAG TPA: hypothetical protein ENL08_02300, partial [Bacteroidetes bacterium]|nr:hypothetical protein [Bacteroidota bacterium]
GGLPSFLPSELKGVAMNFGLELPTEEIYQTILGSRTLKERIVERFKLREVYRMSEDVFPEDVLDAFSSHYFVETLEDQSIAVSVEDRDPELAAAMTNACVEELDRVYSSITRETARKNRIYIGSRLQQVEDSLMALADSIKRFQKSSRAISIPNQVEAMIQTAADIKAEILSNDIQLEIMRTSLGENHPSVSQLRITNRELKDKYDRLLSGEEGGFSLSLDDLPELNRQYAQLIREVKIQNALQEYIYPQYESARIQEERETANVQVLDYARVPNKKSRPPRKMIVLIAAFMSVIVTLIAVLLLEYWRTLPQRNRADWEKMQNILRFLGRR